MNKKKKIDPRQKNLIHGINPDVLIYEMFQKTDIRFVGSNLYMPHGGWCNATEEYVADMFTTFKEDEKKPGKVLEFVIEGDDWIIEQLKDYSSDYAFGFHLSEAIGFLEANGFTFEMVCEEEAPSV